MKSEGDIEVISKCNVRFVLISVLFSFLIPAISYAIPVVTYRGDWNEFFSRGIFWRLLPVAWAIGIPMIIAGGMLLHTLCVCGGRMLYINNGSLIYINRIWLSVKIAEISAVNTRIRQSYSGTKVVDIEIIQTDGRVRTIPSIALERSVDLVVADLTRAISSSEPGKSR